MLVSLRELIGPLLEIDLINAPINSRYDRDSPFPQESSYSSLVFDVVFSIYLAFYSILFPIQRIRLKA